MNFHYLFILFKQSRYIKKCKLFNKLLKRQTLLQVKNSASYSCIKLN
jgi:hypothetical protein